MIYLPSSSKRRVIGIRPHPPQARPHRPSGIVLHFANLTTPRPPPDIVAALRHAANPTREQFTQEILPLLEPFPRSERILAAQTLAKFLEAVPGADPRKLWIDAADPYTPNAE
jgi:hypothetical protein